MALVLVLAASRLISKWALHTCYKQTHTHPFMSIGETVFDFGMSAKSDKLHFIDEMRDRNRKMNKSSKINACLALFSTQARKNQCFRF